MQIPSGNRLQPETIGAVMKVTKWLKPSISVSQIGGGASVQAATRVNAEQSSKRTMRRSMFENALNEAYGTESESDDMDGTFLD